VGWSIATHSSSPPEPVSPSSGKKRERDASFSRYGKPEGRVRLYAVQSERLFDRCGSGAPADWQEHFVS
jgi:hypothetical protein